MIGSGHLVDRHAWNRGVPDELGGSYRDPLENLASGLTMPIGIAKCCRIVLRIQIQIKALRIAEIGIGYSCGFRRPIGCNKPPDGIAIVSGSEVIAAGFGVAFFVCELVAVVDTQISNYAFTTEGIEIQRSCLRKAGEQYQIQQNSEGDVCMDKNVLRNKSIGTRVSEEEYTALEKLAEARGLTLGKRTWYCFPCPACRKQERKPALKACPSRRLAGWECWSNCSNLSRDPWEYRDMTKIAHLLSGTSSLSGSAAGLSTFYSG